MRPKSSPHDLAAVLRRCARQDRSALDLLKALYTRPLEAYARCCLPADEATQITADTFELIWRYAPHYTAQQGEALGWLMSIYRHRLAQGIHHFRAINADLSITHTAPEALAPLIRQLKEPTAQSVFLRLLRTLDPTQQKLLLGRYLFAWADSDCVNHTDLDAATVGRQLRQAAQTLSQQLAPWAIADQAWQTENALACIDALNPQNIDPAVAHRRQNESAATQDTLRWEALLAQLCMLLEPDAATALGVQAKAGIGVQPGTGVQKGTGPKIDPTPVLAQYLKSPEATHNTQAQKTQKPSKNQKLTENQKTTGNQRTSENQKTTEKQKLTEQADNQRPHEADFASSGTDSHAHSTARQAHSTVQKPHGIVQSPSSTAQVSHQAGQTNKPQAAHSASGSSALQFENTPQQGRELENEFDNDQNLAHSQAAGLMQAMQEQAIEDNVEETHLLIHALKKQKRRSFLWQLFAFFNLLIVIGLAMLLFLPRPAAVQVIEMAPRLGAVLQAPGHSATPGWVLSVDPQGQVLLMPLVPTDITANQRVHLWTRGPNDNQLQSLGLINPNQPVTLTTDIIGTVTQGQLFEMTLEQADQTTTHEPQGPILFMGRVVSLGDYEVLDESAAAAQPNRQ